MRSLSFRLFLGLSNFSDLTRELSLTFNLVAREMDGLFMPLYCAPPLKYRGQMFHDPGFGNAPRSSLGWSPRFSDI